jgi:hypothetical protein
MPPYEVPPLPEATIVVLPEAIEGDVGIYPNAATMLVKELRAAGIPAEYLHDPDHRQWHVLMGDVPTELIIGVVTGLMSTGIGASFAHFLGGGSRKRAATVHVVRQRRQANGDIESTTVDIEGTGPELQELLETALGDGTGDDAQ